MRHFIELRNSYDNTPILVQVEQIAIVTKSVNQGKTVVLMNGTSSEDFWSVKESYESVVRMIRDVLT